MEEEARPSAQIEDAEEKPGLRERLSDLRIIDKLIIPLAFVLSICAFAVLFRPNMAESLGKAFLVMTTPDPVPAQPEPPKPPVTPGVVDMQLFTPSAPAAAAKAPAGPEPKKN